MNWTQTTLDIPETTFILTQPVLNGSVSADINWLAGSRGSITLSFCGVNVLNDDDCKTVPTPVQIRVMRCDAIDGEVQARSIYLFKARQINMTHGLCDAERPNKAPHGLMLKFNVRGNRPETTSCCLSTSRCRCPTSCSPWSWSACATCSCGTPMRRRATQPWCWRRRRPRHSRGRSMSYSTLCTGLTHSCLRTPTCTARCTSVKHTPQSLLSEAAAKHLDKLHQFPDRPLPRISIVMSLSRRAVCSPFGACPARRVGLTTG